MDYADFSPYIPKQLKRLAEDLNRTGKLTLFLTKQSCFSCHTGVLIYDCKNEDKKVHFSISAAASLTFSGLIKKLVTELWQSYIYLCHKSDAPETSVDLYKSNFIRANNLETPRLFDSYIIDSSNTFLNDYSIEDLKDSIKQFSDKLYYYHATTQSGFDFVKFISIDFFTHINPKEK